MPPPAVPAASAARVLVLVPVYETPIDAPPEELGRTLAEGLAEGGGLEPALAAAAIDEACLERLACLREQGRAVDAAFVVATTLVALGDTAMVRVRFVPVDETGTEQTRQVAVTPVDLPSLGASLQRVGGELAAPFAPEPEPQHPGRRRLRWLGPVLGALVVGAVAGTVVATRPRDPQPDVVIRPP